MDTGAVVTPPVRGGDRCACRRSAGVRLAPAAIGDPASARALRPTRTAPSPPGSRSWQERGQLRRDDEPALYLHEYTAGGLTVRGLVGALDISHRATGPEDRAGPPARGDPPACRPTSSPTG